MSSCFQVGDDISDKYVIIWDPSDCGCWSFVDPIFLNFLWNNEVLKHKHATKKHSYEEWKIFINEMRGMTK